MGFKGPKKNVRSETADMAFFMIKMALQWLTCMGYCFLFLKFLKTI